jgi:hypothetical protein
MRFFGNHTPHYHLYTDNQAAEHIATQPTMSEHSRSIDLRHHSIRQDYIENGMRIGGVSSKDNTADILTKALQPDLHLTHTSHLFPDRITTATTPNPTHTHPPMCTTHMTRTHHPPPTYKTWSHKHTTTTYHHPSSPVAKHTTTQL